MIKQIYETYLSCGQIVVIDTKKITKGAMFVAVGRPDARGVARGNQWARAAVEDWGAGAAIISDSDLYEIVRGDARFIFVEDSEKALQALAAYHRAQWKIQSKGALIAIGGSNGKTTTKELICSVLSAKYKVFATLGNLNNHLGVPLSLLALRAEHQVAIIEIGANHLGETAHLAVLAAPDFVLLTNCGKDHVGEYGSFENVVKGNAELYDYAAEHKRAAFVSTDDALILQLSQHIENRHFYGSGQAVSATVAAAPLLALDLRINAEPQAVQTKLFGRFWRDTVVAAAAIGHYFNVDNQQIITAIQNYTPAALRSQQLIWRGYNIWLDCYNANPSSVAAFLEAVADDKIHDFQALILGEMLELGAYEAAEHLEVLAHLAAARPELQSIFLVGAAFQNLLLSTALAHRCHRFLTAAQVAAHLAANPLPTHAQIYVKGSRGNRLESIFGLASH